MWHASPAELTSTKYARACGNEPDHRNGVEQAWRFHGHGSQCRAISTSGAPAWLGPGWKQGSGARIAHERVSADDAHPTETLNFNEMHTLRCERAWGACKFKTMLPDDAVDNMCRLQAGRARTQARLLTGEVLTEGVRRLFWWGATEARKHALPARAVYRMRPLPAVIAPETSQRTNSIILRTAAMQAR